MQLLLTLEAFVSPLPCGIFKVGASVLSSCSHTQVVFLFLTATCCVMPGKLPPLSGPLPALPFYDAFTSNSLVLVLCCLCFKVR